MPKSIAASVDKVARTALGRDWNLYAGLIERWPEIIGPDYAKETTPVKITFPRGKKTDEKWAGRQGGGTLTLSLPQGLTLEMSHQTERIKSRINSFFGYEAIDKITFKPYYPTSRRGMAFEAEAAPLPPQDVAKLEEGTKDIENNELKEALQALGSSVLANRHKV